jgi:hypothetical protein
MENQGNSLNLKHTAKKHLKVFSAHEKIKEEVVKIPHFEELKSDREFLNSVCNLFEDKVNTKKYNTNKKELVLKLYSELFNDETSEFLTEVAKDIDYLWNHGNIKKTSFYKKAKHASWNLLKNLLQLLVR